MNPDVFSFLLADLSEPNQIFLPDTLGIEVTKPSIAECCGLGNIDPQHGVDTPIHVQAAIEACLDYPLPPVGSRLLTIRPDLDALGGMAVLMIRANGRALGDELRVRIARIAAADRFDQGPWPGPRPLPWEAKDVYADASSEELAILTACAFDRSLTLQKRVRTVAHWLLGGSLPQGYRIQLRNRANALVSSLTVGATRVGSVAGGRIATVVSTDPGALRLGYLLAPVVVALNPAFQFSSGVAGRKYTVARWAEGDADLDFAVTRISDLETGWGGQRGIKGSPQSDPSKLSMERIICDVEVSLPRVTEQ